MEQIQSYEAISGVNQSALNNGMAFLTAGDYFEVWMYQFGATRTISATLGGLQMRFIALS
jgi:hypothetical protein